MAAARSTKGANKYEFMSWTGQYQMMYDASSNLYLSNNYGASFVQSAPTPNGVGTFGHYMSANGQVVILTDTSGNVFTSNNYGAPFSTATGVPAYTTASTVAICGSLNYDYTHAINYYGTTQSNVYTSSPYAMAQYSYMLDGTDSGLVLGSNVSISSSTATITPLGISSKYLVCTGGGNSGCQLPIASLAIPSTGFSINLNFASNATPNWRRIFDFWNSTSSYLYGAIYNNNFIIGVENSDYTSFYTGLNMNTNVWYNVTLVFTPSGGNASVDLYVNKSKVVSAFTTVWPAATYSNSYIAQADYGAGYGFTGSVYKFQFFNSILTAAQIAAIY
jgi:hypothetical protein